jgi:hypothetical protein
MIRGTDQMPWMDIWKQSSEALMNFWARNERWILDHKHSNAAPILSVRFEELTESPTCAWPKIADFLELDADEILSAAAKNTRPEQDRKYEEHQIPLTPEAAEIVKIYGL